LRGLRPPFFWVEALKYTHTFDTSKPVFSLTFLAYFELRGCRLVASARAPSKIRVASAKTVNPSMFTPMNGEDLPAMVEAPTPGKDPINDL
jgi:hypothetical protein